MNRYHYTFIELIAALGILALLSTCVLSSIQSLKNKKHELTQESKAILAVDNAVERLKAMDSFHYQLVQDVVEEEFVAGGLCEEKHVTYTIDYIENQAVIKLFRKNDKEITEVKICCSYE